MVKPNILVVDSDEGFGFMLAEGLQNTGHYISTCVHTGSDAIQAVVEQNFDLVIIDVALTDMKPSTLIKAVREAKNGINIMMIPMMGQKLSRSYEALNISGVLPKPFFVGDLPDLIDKALGRTRQRTPTSPLPMPVRPKKTKTSGTLPISAKEPEEPEAVEEMEPGSELEGPGPGFPGWLPVTIVPQETIRFLRASETEILRLLGDLNREVRAEAILVVAGTELIAHAGILGQDECEELTLLVAQSTQAAAQAAAFLGERNGRFTQSLHEGSSYRLYTLILAEGILLSLALSTNVPLGMIRHQSRQIADQLTKFII